MGGNKMPPPGRGGTKNFGQVLNFANMFTENL